MKTVILCFLQFIPLCAYNATVKVTMEEDEEEEEEETQNLHHQVTADGQTHWTCGLRFGSYTDGGKQRAYISLCPSEWQLSQTHHQIGSLHSFFPHSSCHRRVSKHSKFLADDSFPYNKSPMVRNTIK